MMFELLTDENTVANNTLPGVVRSQAYLGSHRDYIVDVGQELLVTAPAALNVAPGAKVQGQIQCRAVSRPRSLTSITLQRC